MRLAERELSWISASLDAACLRARGDGPLPRVLSAAYIPGDNRLSCLVEAGGADDIHRVFGVASLPSVRVVDAIVVALRTSTTELL